ncbi:MAG: F0F1 ATP synthase subunit B' [Maricaulaceae bacterium]
MAEEAGAEHAADAAHAAEAGLPQLDFSTWPGQIFWLAISFGVLYFVLSRSVLPRIGGAIEDRKDKIADDLDEANRLQRQAEDAQKAYEQSLADARAKAHAIAGETRDRVNEEITARAADAEEQFSKKAEEAETRIRAAAEAAMANVSSVASEVAVALVEKLSGRAPDAGAVSKALDAAGRK